jgi:hypothetical protein
MRGGTDRTERQLASSSKLCVSDLWVIKTGTPRKNVRPLDH